MNKQEKKKLRKKCLEKRNSLSIEERKAFSLIICEKLKPYLKDKNVMSYLAFASEVDVSYCDLDHKFAYPVIGDDHSMKAYRSNGNFILNSYGIKEPDPLTSTIIPKEELEFIIVPCVGFNAFKQRLGHGGGYYDRYLKDCKALKIGVAFEVQKLEEIFSEEHDIPLDLIITEKSVY
ncbi:MAG: 5-formyltetrahydrofolate cyclo-ligase [Erysipelotrichaceae bacterium]|nr:5-formyltetrahydrofolate cyclo-ligase [Erysipelotrichaceae bacterium]